jgi:AcrR family transcriptional regulator
VNGSVPLAGPVGLHPRWRAGKVTAMKHKRSELTRAKIIAAARGLFLANGIADTPVAAICRASGVSNGALFHQFPNKEDLAFAVYSEVRLEYWSRTSL